MSEEQDLLDVAREASAAASEVLMRHFRRAGLEVREKARNDLVSQADQEAEEAVLAVLERRVPDHSVLAEEGGRTRRGESSEWEWLVDPLDGTSNFVHGLAFFAVSIACRHRGQTRVGVIREPVAGHLFSAVRGGGARWNDRPVRVTEQAGLDGAFLATGFPFRAQSVLDPYLGVFRSLSQRVAGMRRCGAAALDLAYTAAGVYDGFFEFGLAPWDVAAGALLVSEAGGSVSDLDGGDGFFDSGNILAAAPGVYDELAAVVRSVTDEDAVRRLIQGAPV